MADWPRVPVRIQDQAAVVLYQERIRDAFIERYTVDVPHNTITWLQPPVNESWEIICFQAELQTDANVGVRNLYQYVADRNFNTMRFQMCKVAASTVAKYVGIPETGGPSATVGPGDQAPLVTGIEQTFVGPCYIRDLDNPCRIGVLKDGINGPGDICTLHLLVRERTRL